MITGATFTLRHFHYKSNVLAYRAKATKKTLNTLDRVYLLGFE